MDLKQFIRLLPKVELHVHLEGSVTPEFWLKLIKKHHPNGPCPTLEELMERFRFPDFQGFLEAFRDIVFSFHAPDDLYDLTRYFLAKAVKQNVKYCEVMFTPWFLVKRGIDFNEMMSEIDRAAKEIENESDIEMKLIFDGPRNFGNEAVREVFTMAMQDKTGRVIGVGIGGDEKTHPARLFPDEFDYARASGLHTIGHAGETDGVESMLDTIQLLKVSRIGHCLGIPESSKLEGIIFENNITLDLCPWSNVATGSIPSIEKHPFPDYLKRGYPITLNSDDPGIFNTNINKEFDIMLELYNLTAEQLAGICANAVSGSFLPDAKKKILSDDIKECVENYQS